MHLCSQRVEELDPATERFAASTQGTAHRLRGQLQLSSSQLASWSLLSPGERKRWQIGAALASEPMALLLDEPTNHLDRVARELLEAALRAYSGVGVLVSHDRSLMSALTEQTLRLDRGTATLYAGGYDQARATWEADEAAERASLEKLRVERRKLERRLDERRRKREVAQSRATTSRRMKNARDSDARLRFKQSRRRSAENALGRDIHRLHGRLRKVDERAAGFQFERELGRSLFVDYEASPVPLLLDLDEAELFATTRADSDPCSRRLLLEDVHIHVRRESRLHLRGPNGSGKTTVLERLIENSHIPRERMLYLPQELSEAQAQAIATATRELAPEQRGRLLGVVAALGVEPGAVLSSLRPSPGEARKLAIAHGLARRVWLLVLDEPTNHLDLPTTERLEQALRAYPGAIVLVTHDDRFAGSLTNTQLDLQGGRVERG